MQLNKLFLGVAFLPLFIPTLTAALPLELQWECVTKNVAGQTIAAPKYRVYKKTTLENFKAISETGNCRWTWLVPSIGRYTFRVTAFNEQGESDPSNELKIVVERIGREDT